MAFGNAVDANQSGFQSVTSAGVWNGRTLTAGTGISITNGDGTAGNPVISSTVTPPPPGPSSFSMVDDFIGFADGVTGGGAVLYGVSNYAWNNGTGGTATADVAPESGHPGMIRLGVASGNGSFIKTGYNSATLNGNLFLGYGETGYTWIIRIPTLSTGGSRFKVFIGLGSTFSNSTITDQTDGVYFTYTDNESSGNWVYNTASGSTRTQTSSGIAASTSWVKLQAVINAAATSVTFYIDGSSVGTVTTNIPTASISPLIQMNGTSGTNYVYIDYFDMYINLTTPR